MADVTLSTGVSRRSMLAGAAALPTLSLSALPLSVLSLPALAPLPAPAASATALADPDARLFRRVAVAERLRKRRARLLRLRARLARSRRPAGLSPQGQRPGSRLLGDGLRERRPTAERQALWDLTRRYAAAVRGALSTPARTLPGLEAKLRLAMIASRRGAARIYLYEERDWLVAALADLDRLIAMDRLIVMDRGRIIEDGDHGSLPRHNGLYAQLWARQSGGFLARDAG